MLLNAVRGLGEQIVSGLVTPDTVEFERELYAESDNDSVHFKSGTIGDPSTNDELCLKTEQLEKIARLVANF